MVADLKLGLEYLNKESRLFQKEIIALANMTKDFKPPYTQMYSII